MDTNSLLSALGLSPRGAADAGRDFLSALGLPTPPTDLERSVVFHPDDYPTRARAVVAYITHLEKYATRPAPKRMAPPAHVMPTRPRARLPLTGPPTHSVPDAVPNPEPSLGTTDELIARLRSAILAIPDAPHTNPEVEVLPDILEYITPTPGDDSPTNDEDPLLGNAYRNSDGDLVRRVYPTGPSTRRAWGRERNKLVAALLARGLTVDDILRRLST